MRKTIIPHGRSLRMENTDNDSICDIYERKELDKVGKEMQLGRMWQQASAAYQYLFQVYQSRGYLTAGEANYANQISQVLRSLQTEKMKVDQDLANEMMKHLMKMMVKQNNH